MKKKGKRVDASRWKEEQWYSFLTADELNQLIKLKEKDYYVEILFHFLMLRGQL
jgi:hypothetical protein